MGAVPYTRKRPTGLLKEAVDVATEIVERRLIAAALDHQNGNALLAARELSISQRCLRYKAEKYGFPVGQSRGEARKE